MGTNMQSIHLVNHGFELSAQFKSLTEWCQEEAYVVMLHFEQKDTEICQ